MKIAEFSAILDAPVGTIFALYQPCTFGEWYIKTSECYAYDEPCDYYPFGKQFLGAMPLSPSLLPNITEVFEPGKYVSDWCAYDLTSWELYHDYYSDDILDDDKKYVAIAEQEDVEQFIKTIRWAQNGCKGDQP